MTAPGGQGGEKDAPPLDAIMARSNTIWCSRCANQGEDDPISFARSWARFQLRGWTYDSADRRVFCPQCSADTGRLTPPEVGPS